VCLLMVIIDGIRRMKTGGVRGLALAYGVPPARSAVASRVVVAGAASKTPA